MLKVSRYRTLKLLDAITQNNILGDNVKMMLSLGSLNQEVAYQLKNLGLDSIQEVREELKKYKV
jgi:hypothetical protein